MKKYFGLFLLLVCVKTILAQASFSLNTDSLQTELEKSKNDTSRVLLLNSLTENFKFFNPTLALRYGREAWILADSLRFERGKVFIAISSGFIMARTSDYPEALSKLLDAEHICERMSMPRELMNVYTLLAVIYATRKQFPTTLDYLSRAKAIRSKYEFKESTIPLNLMSGFIYKDLAMPDSALTFLKEAYQFAEVYKSDQFLPSITFSMGNIFLDLKQTDSSLHYFRKSLSYHADYNEGRVFYGLATLYNATEKIDSSLYYGKKALQHSEENRFIPIAISAAELLSNLSEKQNNLRQALYYKKIAVAQKDSLISEEEKRETEKLTYHEKEREMITQRRIFAHKTAAENKIKIYGLSAFLLFLIILSSILYQNNKSKHRVNISLQEQKEEIEIQKKKAENALSTLTATQAQLVQTEKLASLGELTAGIAHEIQNPLNFVNNFSDISRELLEEFNTERVKPEGERDEQVQEDIVNDIIQNLEKISHHGKRASGIVKSMLGHSRISSGEKELTDINQLCEEYSRLSYHSLQAKDPQGFENKDFKAYLKLNLDPDLPQLKVAPQDLGRVILNLCNNAFYAVSEKTLSLKDQSGIEYRPMVTITTKATDKNVIITVSDNGSGIPETIKDKIFQPFFTSKPAGQGTGLGLSLSYDIIHKLHGGNIRVESDPGNKTTFIIELPV
ncbi:MAG: ATP-binding protein [Saprospiraceae bacterium]